MHLAGGDADLGPHAELAAIGKLGGRVAHQDRTVQPLKEPLGGRVILGQDAFRVAGAELPDMGDGAIHAIDQPGRDDHVQKLAPEIVGLCRDRARYILQLPLGAHLDARGKQILDQHRAVAGVKAAVDQQAFRRPANSGAPSLGVQHHPARLFQIGIGIGIDVANAFQMRKDRHPRLALHQSDQTLAAALSWNKKKAERLMKKMNLKAIVREKRKYYPPAMGEVSENLLNRNFSAEKPDEKWLTDVTEFKCDGQKLYLSPILDLYNREIRSYHLSRRPNSEMVATMLPNVPAMYEAHFGIPMSGAVLNTLNTPISFAACLSPRASATAMPSR